MSNITFNDHGNVRPLFWRLSIAEMVVPYGCPEFPHTRKHAFDLGEYGAGFMANSLALGCDCKGAISYLDAAFNLRNGDAYEIKNAICIHEEDSGVLHKHTDYRTGHTMVTRARKLVVSQAFTAANYDYLMYSLSFPLLIQLLVIPHRRKHSTRVEIDGYPQHLRYEPRRTNTRLGNSSPPRRQRT